MSLEGNFLETSFRDDEDSSDGRTGGQESVGNEVCVPGGFSNRNSSSNIGVNILGLVLGEDSDLEDW